MENLFILIFSTEREILIKDPNTIEVEPVAKKRTKAKAKTPRRKKYVQLK